MRNLVQPENLVKLLKLLLRYILTIIRHIDFKSGNINFQKDRKQPAKYKHLDIASFNNFEKYIKAYDDNLYK